MTVRSGFVGSGREGCPRFATRRSPFPSHLRELLPRLCGCSRERRRGATAQFHVRGCPRPGVHRRRIAAESVVRGEIEKPSARARIHMGLAPDPVAGAHRRARLLPSLAHHLQSNLCWRLPISSGTRSRLGSGILPLLRFMARLDWKRRMVLAPKRSARRRRGRRGAALRCSFCAASWELKTYRCIYCGNAGDRFMTAAPDMARTDQPGRACGACGGTRK